MLIFLQSKTSKPSWSPKQLSKLGQSQTPDRSSRRSQRMLGFTLFELLIVILLLASIASLSSIAFRSVWGFSLLEQASAQLVSDLKSSRQLAKQQQKIVSVHFRDDGYDIASLNIHRNFGDPIQLVLKHYSPLIFQPGGLSKGRTLLLVSEKRRAQLVVAPLTGRISRELSPRTGQS